MIKFRSDRRDLDPTQSVLQTAAGPTKMPPTDLVKRQLDTANLGWLPALKKQNHPFYCGFTPRTALSTATVGLRWSVKPDPTFTRHQTLPMSQGNDHGEPSAIIKLENHRPNTQLPPDCASEDKELCSEDKELCTADNVQRSSAQVKRIDLGIRFSPSQHSKTSVHSESGSRQLCSGLSARFLREHFVGKRLIISRPVALRCILKN